MRLDKFISNATDYSRSEVKKLIRSGEVVVDGELARRPEQKVSENSQVEVAGMNISTPGLRYYMLYKPEGYVSVTKDSEHPTAIDLMVDESRPELLQIAGRLDIDATGLLLVTDDGQWNHTVTSPRKDCFKTYLVSVADAIDETQLQHYREKLERGIWLDNEKRRTLPALITPVNEFQFRLQIQEGKYHQVKRMVAALGNHVNALHREAIGDIVLDPELQPGEYRPLSDEEIESIQ